MNNVLTKKILIQISDYISSPSDMTKSESSLPQGCGHRHIEIQVGFYGPDRGVFEGTFEAERRGKGPLRSMRDTTT